MQNARGPIRSSLPVKESKKDVVQMPSESSLAQSRISDATLTELEDLFEEGY